MLGLDSCQRSFPCPGSSQADFKKENARNKSRSAISLEHIMITDPKFKSKIGRNLDESKLNTYWTEFFRYQREAPRLYGDSEVALK